MAIRNGYRIIFILFTISLVQICIYNDIVQSVLDSRNWFIAQSGSSSLNVTWTALDSSNPTVIQPNASPVIIGDHVQINATLSDAEIDATELHFSRIIEEGVVERWNVTQEGNSSTFDTYRLLENTTVNVKVTALLPSGSNHSFYLGEMTFYNYFAPILSTISEQGEGYERTYTWSCIDRNSQDEHFYEVLLSADSGETYQLLQSNLTEPRFVWDSERFLHQTYLLKVRVMDNDPEENPTALSTGAYWPGLNSSSTITVHMGDIRDRGDPVPFPTPSTTPTSSPSTTNPSWSLPLGLLGIGVYYSSLVVIIVFSILIIKSRSQRP